MCDDFCVIHGYDHMRCNRGFIPYCEACDNEKYPKATCSHWPGQKRCGVCGMDLTKVNGND
jgi:hypothetical protein